MHRFSLVTVSLALLALDASACSCANEVRPGRDGGPGFDAGTGTGNDTGIPPTDTGIVPRDIGPITNCMGHPTSVTGTTYAPNGMDPLPGLIVAAFPDSSTFPAAAATVQCQTCVSNVPGSVAFIRSGADGTFTLGGPGLDAGGTYTIVIYSGGFRRVVRGVSVPMCGDLALTAAQTSLPGASSGDDLIPRIAIASSTTTGDVNDKFAHVLDVIGITGYDRFGPDKTGTAFGSMDLIALFTTPTRLAQYDIVIAPCGSLGNFSVSPVLTAAMVTNLQAWLAAGGRLYASDLAYEIAAESFPSAMTFATGPSSHAGADDADVGQGIASGSTIMADVDDADLLAWLRLVGAAGATSTQIPVGDLRDPWAAIDLVPPANLVPDTSGVLHERVLVSADVRWHTTTAAAHHPLTVQADYPNGSGGYCGRMVFTSYHVQTGTGTTLAPQERVLEYIFFQLSSCIQAGPM